MYVGFIVRHIVRKLMIGGAVVACVGLATEAGQRAAKIVVAATKGAARAAFDAAKAQPGT